MSKSHDHWGAVVPARRQHHAPCGARLFDLVWPRPARSVSHVPDQDRAGQFTDSFDAVFQSDGIRILASPPQAPRANAICERIIGTLPREVPGQLLTVSEHHLRQVLTEYILHYNTARPHRALGQLTPGQARTWPPPINLAEHRIRRKQVLGGLTSEYQIAA
jgi:putative transposase